MPKPPAPLRCVSYDNVTILPMQAVDVDPVTSYALGAFSEGKPLREVHRYVWNQRLTRQLPFRKASKYSAQEVIYGGVFNGHWGHFLTETLQRLWFAKKNPLPIIWLRGAHVSGTEFFSPQHEAVFESLGLKNSHIFVYRASEFARVHFPEPGFGLMPYAHPEHFAFLRHYEGTVRKGKYVYFSRSRFTHCVNEKQLETMLAQRGWDIVYPEALTLTEQLEILTSAQVCLMIAGSAQHSLALTKNCKTRFIVIPRVHTITYELIAAYCAEDYFLFHAKREVVNGGMDASKNTFSLDVQAIENIIEKTCDFTINLNDFSDILQKVNCDAQKYQNLPSIYYNADVSLSKGEEYFYEAIFLWQEKSCKEAYALCMRIYEEKLLQAFMLDHFLNIINTYEKEHGRKTNLKIDKSALLLAEISNKLAAEPKNGEHYIHMAELLTKMQRYSAAMHILQKAVRKFPKWALPYAGMAKAYVAQGQFIEALQAATEAFRLAPHELAVRDVLSYCLNLQKKNN